MNFEGLVDKAKDLAADNRETIESQVDKFIDSEVQGENAERAKMGVDKALDSLLGRGDNPETTEPAGTPAEN